MRSFVGISNWMVVVVSLERLTYVSFPHNAKALLTRNKAIVVVCILPLIIFAMEIGFILIVAKPKIVQYTDNQPIFKQVCVSISNPAKSKGLLTAYFVWSSYLPVFSVITSSVITILKLAKNRSTVVGSNQETHGKKAVSHVTKMLLGICLMFFITNGIFALYITFGSRVHTPSHLASFKNEAYRYVQGLYVINYTCNFWVYTATGPTFRRELIKVFSRYKLFSWMVVKSRVGTEVPSNITQSSMQ